MCINGPASLVLYLLDLFTLVINDNNISVCMFSLCYTKCLHTFSK